MAGLGEVRVTEQLQKRPEVTRSFAGPVGGGSSATRLVGEETELGEVGSSHNGYFGVV